MRIKPLFFFVCFVLFSINLSAQNVNIDSIRNFISEKNTPDTTKVLLWDMLASAYPDAKTDSILAAEYRALTLSRKIKYLDGEATVLLNLATVLSRIGNLPKALTAAFEALRIEEARQNFRNMAQCYSIIGAIYMAQNDLRKVLYYTLAEKETRDKIDGTSKSWAPLFNLAGIYLKLGQRDSALLYLNEAFQIAGKKNDPRMAIILAQFGDIYTVSGDSALALDHYRTALQEAVNNRLPAVQSIAMSLAAFFNKAGQTDSAIYYAKISFDKSVSLGNIQNTLEAALLLAKEYEGDNVNESYRYYKIAVAAKDSLFSIEKINELQKLTGEEELHRQEINEERKKAIESQKNAIQITGISIFLPAFFLVVVLLGRLRVRPRFIEFMGILSLLFVFEFITLIIHPFIEKWTNHQPALMLLILVGIAAFLVPMHHRIERWMKEHLVTRRIKKIIKEELTEEGL